MLSWRFKRKLQLLKLNKKFVKVVTDILENKKLFEVQKKYKRPEIMRLFSIWFQLMLSKLLIIDGLKQKRHKELTNFNQSDSLLSRLRSRKVSKIVIYKTSVAINFSSNGLPEFKNFSRRKRFFFQTVWGLRKEVLPLA